MPATWTNGEIELVAERAYQLHLQGKHADAAIIFEGLLAIDPRNLYCLEALAALSLKLGSAEKALQYADRALALSPKAVRGARLPLRSEHFAESFGGRSTGLRVNQATAGESPCGAAEPANRQRRKIFI